MIDGLQHLKMTPFQFQFRIEIEIDFKIELFPEQTPRKIFPCRDSNVISIFTRNLPRFHYFYSANSLSILISNYSYHAAFSTIRFMLDVSETLGVPCLVTEQYPKVRHNITQP